MKKLLGLRFQLSAEVWLHCVNHRKMLNKGKKPEPKEGAKEAPQVPAAPVRPETPKLLRAALEMAERSSGLRGAMFKVKEKTNKSSISLQVNTETSQTDTFTVLCSSTRNSLVFVLPAVPLLLFGSSFSNHELWTWHAHFHLCQLLPDALHPPGAHSAPSRSAAPRQRHRQRGRQWGGGGASEWQLMLLRSRRTCLNRPQWRRRTSESKDFCTGQETQSRNKIKLNNYKDGIKQLLGGLIFSDQPFLTHWCLNLCPAMTKNH